MEIKYDSFSWKDVYLYWQLKTNDLLNCVNQPIPCKKIKVAETSDKRRVCYPSWLKNDYSRDIIPAFNKWMEMPLYDRYLPFSDERVSRSAKLRCCRQEQKQNGQQCGYLYSVLLLKKATCRFRIIL